MHGFRGRAPLSQHGAEEFLLSKLSRIPMCFTVIDAALRAGVGQSESLEGPLAQKGSNSLAEAKGQG